MGGPHIRGSALEHLMKDGHAAWGIICSVLDLSHVLGTDHILNPAICSADGHHATVQICMLPPCSCLNGTACLLVPAWQITRLHAGVVMLLLLLFCERAN